LDAASLEASAAGDGLMESIVDATAGSSERGRAADGRTGGQRPDQQPGRLERFLREPSPGRALRLWFGWPDAVPEGVSAEGVARTLGRHIAQIDAMLNRQVNAIIHHERFQKIEGSWRGLSYLVEQADGSEGVVVRVLSASWKDLAKDAERAVEFDQSQLFRKIYSDEFGIAGGEPFSVLLGDYQIHARPSAEHPFDDLAVLEAISGVAAAAFAPFIAAVHPSTLGLDDFTNLERPLNLSRTFEQTEYVKWRAFREREDSRFVGLTLPQVLMRTPYEDDGSRTDGFRFQEDVAGPDRRKYLWGNAAYAFGAVMVRSFANSGWLADIRGVERGIDGGGLVTGLPVHCFSTDKHGVAPKCSTDVIITDRQEPDLSELGFIPLCHCRDTDLAAFYANQSIQKPKQYDDLAVTMNAKISSMLQYMLCVSRFAHYLKVAAREKLGSFTEAEDVERYLDRWVQSYVTSDASASPSVKAKFPLREARVRITEHPENPGGYVCTAHLWPHFELDALVAALKVKTVLTPGRQA
jgi:type VI secretion system ImpC/EvpB family protein